MASDEIEVTRTAEGQLRKLDRQARRRVLRAIQALADGPRPQGSRKLTGYDDVFRIRVATHRVLYSVEDRKLVVLILKIGHRRDLYR
ncbi:MAG: type II toxin-antitoxin system RelE/ParE family toxin [Thermoanaerobaculia bacterium]